MSYTYAKDILSDCMRTGSGSTLLALPWSVGMQGGGGGEGGGGAAGGAEGGGRLTMLKCHAAPVRQSPPSSCRESTRQCTDAPWYMSC